MYNFFNKVVFSFDVWYQVKSPIKKGNAFLGRLIKNLSPITYCIEGIRFKLNPVSYIDFHLLAYRTHDESIRKWMDQLLQPDDVFLDIDANIGYFSLYAAKIRKANVIAFEPSKRELHRFYTNIAINELNNIIVYPFALGKETAKLTLNLADYQNPGKNSIVHTENNNRFKQEIINVTTLGDLVSTALLSKIKLVKMDVEGYEYYVLQGLASVMEHLQKAVFIIEITTFSDFDPDMEQTYGIYNFFKEFNFKAQIGVQLNTQYNEVFSK